VTELTLLSLNKAYRSAYATLSSALGWYGVSMSKVRPWRAAALLVSGCCDESSTMTVCMQLGLSNSNPVILLAQRYPALESDEVCTSSPKSKVSFMGHNASDNSLLCLYSCIFTP
jgi:hypothetical protein